jgi:hypothetical protein
LTLVIHFLTLYRVSAPAIAILEGDDDLLSNYMSALSSKVAAFVFIEMPPNLIRVRNLSMGQRVEVNITQA